MNNDYANFQVEYYSFSDCLNGEDVFYCKVVLYRFYHRCSLTGCIVIEMDIRQFVIREFRRF